MLACKLDDAPWLDTQPDEATIFNSIHNYELTTTCVTIPANPANAIPTTPHMFLPEQLTSVAFLNRCTPSCLAGAHACCFQAVTPTPPNLSRFWQRVLKRGLLTAASQSMMSLTLMGSPHVTVAQLALSHLPDLRQGKLLESQLP